MIKLALTQQEIDNLLKLTRGECQLCDNKGYRIVIDKSNRLVGVDCECTKNFAYFAQYVKAGVGRKYWAFTIDDLEEEFVDKNKESLDELKFMGEDIDKFIRDGRQLYIYGEFGTGKTALSLWLLKQAIRVHDTEFYDFKYKCGLMTLRELVNLLVEAQMDATKKPLVTAIEQLDLLVIDEFDKEHATGSKEKFSGVAFGDIFNQFYSNQKAMIVISNLCLSDFDQQVSGDDGMKGVHTRDVLDRLAEFEQIKLVGSSHRRSVKSKMGA